MRTVRLCGQLPSVAQTLVRGGNGAQTEVYATQSVADFCSLPH
jgi:hypothetical protein